MRNDANPVHAVIRDFAAEMLNAKYVEDYSEYDRRQQFKKVAARTVLRLAGVAISSLLPVRIRR